MKTYLFVYSIGPVQSFIAAARKTEDFWSGSYLLSFLTEQTIRTALLNERNRVQLLSPAVTIEQLDSHVKNESADVASLPNRFLLRLDANGDEEVATFAKQLEQTTVQTFQKLANTAINKVFDTLDDRQFMKRLAGDQVANFIEIFWSFEEWTGSYNETRLTVEKRLASVKNNRSFTAQAQDALVCTVCGSHEALNDGNFSEDSTNVDMQRRIEQTWRTRTKNYQEKKGDQESENDRGGRIRDNERLCAICLTKRIAREIFEEQYKDVVQCFTPFPSVFDFTTDNNHYYAMIMMDGDDMGKWISGAEDKVLSGYNKIDEAYHREISRRLTVFSEQSVPQLVKQANGRLVYAGGDDVLAFVPLPQLLPLIQSLRAAFSSEQGLDDKATASMGVVIAHRKEPLQRVITSVRGLEAKAKSYKNSAHKKDAVAFGLLSKSGQIREAIIPWYIGKDREVSNIELLIRLCDAFGETLSSTFLYHFGEAFLPLIPQGKKTDLAPEMIDLELRRLITRASLKMKQEELDQLTEDLLEVYELSPTFLGFIHLLEIIRFIGRKMEQEEVVM